MVELELGGLGYDEIKRFQDENLSWEARLVRAESANEFTPEDRRFAGSWLVCAVGEHVVIEHDQRDYIKSDYQWGGPTNEDLQELGLEFYHAVISNDIIGAREKFEKIKTFFS